LKELFHSWNHFFEFSGHVLAFVATLTVTFAVFREHGASHFSWHPTLMSVGVLCFMTESVMAINSPAAWFAFSKSTRGPTTEGLLKLRQGLQVVSLLFVWAGVASVVSFKRETNRTLEPQSLHAWGGIVAVVCITAYTVCGQIRYCYMVTAPAGAAAPPATQASGSGRSGPQGAGGSGEGGGAGGGNDVHDAGSASADSVPGLAPANASEDWLSRCGVAAYLLSLLVIAAGIRLATSHFAIAVVLWAVLAALGASVLQAVRQPPSTSVYAPEFSRITPSME
jgi:hypothetical protein